MSRVRKLLIVGLVLAVGMGLAWPFRKTGPSVGPTELQDTRLATAVDSSSYDPLQLERGPMQIAAQRHTTAKVASTGDSPVTSAREASFDLANHPALARQPVSKPSEPVTPTDLLGVGQPGSVKRQNPTSRPAYATSEVGREAENRQEILHIVRNTDTLEKLAKRYLGDAGRALEIFDLNRDLLSNPHLLPIGAKLKIPKSLERELD